MVKWRAGGFSVFIISYINGFITNNENVLATAQLEIYAWQTTNKAARIVGQDAQTADLMNYANVSNVILSGVNGIGGRFGRKAVVTKTADYTATTADNVIICNKATAMTITLPAATGKGQEFTIKNINAGTVTVDGNSSDTIDGSATKDLLQWASITIIDYAANAWAVV